MKAQLLLPVILVALSIAPAFSQVAPAFSQAQPGQTTINVPQRSINVAPNTMQLPGQPQPEKFMPFSLDFPGGTPRQLVAALEKAMSRRLNFVIPAEEPDIKFPPFKVNNVSLWNLSEALGLTSRKIEIIGTGYGGGGGGGFGSLQQQISTSYGFRSQGPPSDDAIWYFYVEKPNMPPVVPKVCRYYPLTSYLERGLTVDDITTAIQTGWKLLGDQETPTISFHKETKLLIAVGEQSKLETIDAVLKALAPLAPKPGEEFTERLQSMIRNAGGNNTPPAAPKPAEKPKTEN